MSVTSCVECESCPPQGGERTEREPGVHSDRERLRGLRAGKPAGGEVLPRMRHAARRGTRSPTGRGTTGRHRGLHGHRRLDRSRGAPRSGGRPRPALALLRPGSSRARGGRRHRREVHRRRRGRRLRSSAGARGRPRAGRAIGPRHPDGDRRAQRGRSLAGAPRAHRSSHRGGPRRPRRRSPQGRRDGVRRRHEHRRADPVGSTRERRARRRGHAPGFVPRDRVPSGRAAGRQGQGGATRGVGSRRGRRRSGRPSSLTCAVRGPGSRARPAHRSGRRSACEPPASAVHAARRAGRRQEPPAERVRSESWTPTSTTATACRTARGSPTGR